MDATFSNLTIGGWIKQREIDAVFLFSFRPWLEHTVLSGADYSNWLNLYMTSWTPKNDRGLFRPQFQSAEHGLQLLSSGWEKGSD